MRTGLIGVFICLVVGGAPATQAAHAQLRVAASWSDYDAFMKLSVDERRPRFVVLSAENKAMIMQTHVKRWLHNNNGRLTSHEPAVFDEIIAFMTPNLYRERRDDTRDKREDAMWARMQCRVNPEDVREATNVFADSPRLKVKWTYLSQAKCWIDSAIEGVVDLVPDTRR